MMARTNFGCTINGKLIFYPNISNPPGELGFSHTDVYHLARALLTLRENGYIIITDEIF